VKAPATPPKNTFSSIDEDGDGRYADGLLMPAKKGQAPPDLRYFNRE
jgi:hypothetical protein